jgi:hypothetical protein
LFIAFITTVTCHIGFHSRRLLHALWFKDCSASGVAQCIWYMVTLVFIQTLSINVTFIGDITLFIIYCCVTHHWSTWHWKYFVLTSRSDMFIFILFPLMHSQVTRSRTFFVASMVLTSIVHSMCSCMSTKTARLWKSGLANIAFIRLISSVCSFMCCQAILGCKTFLANVTFTRFVPRVYPFMCCQISRV